MSIDVPHLQDLEIIHEAEWVEEDDPELVIEIPRGKLDRLRHLKLAQVELQWDITALSKLRTLDLTHLGPLGLPSASQILTVLRASPGLVELKLGHCRFESLHAVDAAPVHLPTGTEYVILV